MIASPPRRPSRFSLPLVLAALAALAFPVAAQEASGWLIAGPFDASGLPDLADGLDIDYLASSGLSPRGEASAKPSLVGTEGKKAWREAGAASIGDGEGVDFAAAFGQVEDAVAYAYRTFRSAAAVAAVLRIGSDDGAKIWLNGKLVYGSHEHRSLVAGQDAALVSLAEGENRLLVKVDQGWGSWEFRLGIVDPAEERRAASGLRPSALVLRLDEDAARPGGLVSGLVMTQPAALIDGFARVELADDSGRVLGSATAALCGRFEIPVPADAPEVCRLLAVGGGGARGLSSPIEPLAVGDPVALARAAAASARSASRARFARAPVPGPCPDPAATLDFLAAELEGRIPEILRTRGSVICALGDVKSVAYGSAPLPGLHRYAYRSGIDGSVQPYSLYLPEGYDPARSYGLVLALHGATGNDWDMAAAVAGSRPGDFLVAAPYGRGDLGWTATGERDAIDVLDLVCGGYSVDPDRVYLTGRSMGGFGTWRLGQLYADRFAAIAPFAGWTGTDCLENLLGLPVLVVHGEEDRSVPIDEDRAAVGILRELGANVRFDSLPGVGHDAFESWTREEGPERLLDWFRRWRRSSWPDEVSARTSQARYGRRAWVRVLGLSRPLVPAALDASIVDGRHLRIETENVSAFSLDLRHPRLEGSGRLLLLVDGMNLTADASSPEALFELGDDGRFRAAGPGEKVGTLLPAREAELAAPALNGGAGLAGLFDGPVSLVYGTARRDRAGINRAAALALAGRDEEGILSVGASLGSYPVLADVEVDDRVMAGSSIVLVGGVEENSVLARLAGRLPLSIGGGRTEIGGTVYKGAGTLVICPNPEARGRLLCVFALPFERDRVVGFAGALYVAMRAFGSEYGACGFGTPDVMVLDSSLRPLWSGGFDREWRELVER